MGILFRETSHSGSMQRIAQYIVTHALSVTVVYA